MSDVRVIAFDRNTEKYESGGEDLLQLATKSEATWLWVDVAGPLDPPAKKFLQQRLRVPPLAIQDAARLRHPPKLELLDEYSFLLLREIAGDDSGRDPEINQTSIFVNAQVMITTHAMPSLSVESTMAALADKPDVARKGPANLAYILCRSLIDACEPVVLAQEEALAKIEDDIFDRADDSAVEALSRLNRVLRRMRRVLAYQSKVFEHLRAKVRETVVPFDRDEAGDLFDNVDRLATLCQLNQELAVDLLNTHLSVVSHRLNTVMQALTVATIIFLPLGLLAGIYGMNFNVMPELGWPFGYFAVLGVMGTVATTLVVYFKLKRWI